MGSFKKHLSNLGLMAVLFVLLVLPFSTFGLNKVEQDDVLGNVDISKTRIEDENEDIGETSPSVELRLKD